MTAKDERRTELPEWARFVVIDSDGSAWAFEDESDVSSTTHITYWKRGGGRCASLSQADGAFRLSDDSVRRLVFALPTPPSFDSAVDRRGVRATDAEILPVRGIIGGEG